MPSAAITAQGVELKIGDGATTEIFTTIAEIVSFSGPGGTASIIDVTSLSSTAKEKRVGMMDEGKLTFEMNLNPDNVQHLALKTDRAARTLRNFKLVLTDTTPTTLAFAAYVSGMSISGGVDDVVKCSVTLEISGAVTWT